MRRIPFEDNANGGGDNLAAASGAKFLRGGYRADAFVFGIGPDPPALLTVDGLRRYLTETLQGQHVPPDELAHLVSRQMVYVLSSNTRRTGKWEKTSWWAFADAESRSVDSQHVIAAGLTRNP